jgi:serine/threonine protein kinase
MTDASRDVRIADLLLRWEEEREMGNDLPIDQLCAECPELRDEVEQKVEALKRMAWMSVDSEEPPLPEVVVGRYKVEHLLGQGGHGRVVLAFDTELERRVAIKIPYSPLAPLKEEARRIAKLRHDNIVAVHDVVEDDGQWFLVSDYIDGQSLADLIAAGPLEIEEAISLIATVAEALDYAHEQGFIHRDIKPANILIDANGKPFLTDFGIAVSSGDETTDNLGTVAYMSPEQIAVEKQLIGPRSDIYSLGVVLYECLTGKLPYQVDTPLMARESVLFRHQLPPSTWNGQVGKWLNRICLHCLSKHPEGRYESGKALAEALRSPDREPIELPSWLKTSGIFLCGAMATFLVSFVLNFEPQRPVEAEKPPTVIVENDALVFDGSYRIVTPVERFAPCTLEAWIMIEDYDNEHPRFIIGSDLAPRFGNSLGIIGAGLVAEYIPTDSQQGIIFSDATVPLNKWTHVAAVFGETETRLYLNGKHVVSGPATKQLGGTRFVIGCVGDTNPIDSFIGKVRSVRISEGERYSGDFEALPLDDSGDVVALYSSRVDGPQLTDLSRSENHGQVIPRASKAAP